MVAGLGNKQPLEQQTRNCRLVKRSWAGEVQPRQAAEVWFYKEQHVVAGAATE